MKKIVNSIFVVFLIVFINVFFLMVSQHDDTNYEVEVNIEMNADKARNIQLFFSETGEYTEIQSQTILYDMAESKTLNFYIPISTRYIRLDIGDNEGEVLIEKMSISAAFMDADLLADFSGLLSDQNMVKFNHKGGKLQLACVGNDPYIVLDIKGLSLEKYMEEYQKHDNLKRKGALCITFDVIILTIFLKRKKIKGYLNDFFVDRGLILDLAKNDFKTKYAGSYLGIIWAFVQPMITILVYWFVFQMGFRSGIVEGVPFVLWLTAGLVPWFFFNEALNSATSSLLDYSYLVKKVVFNVSIIPPVRIMSSLFVHIFFCLFMLFMFIINGIYPSIEWLQLVYYSGCLLLLLLGITYMTSALVVFFRDLAQIIIVVLQIGMWMTPIMWSKDMLIGKWRLIYQLNPFYYIVQGYRDSVIYHKWFWESEYETIYFWVFTCVCIYIGMRIFSKLKVHFADVI